MAMQNDKSELDRLIRLNEVGEMLGGLCKRSILRLISKGDLPQPLKVGQVSMLPVSEVQAYIDKLKQRRRR